MVQPETRPPKDEHSGKNGRDQDLWRYLGLGTQLTITVGLFVALGWWLDRQFGWTPWGLLVAATVGIGFAMFGFLKDVLD